MRARRSAAETVSSRASSEAPASVAAISFEAA
jgi:hypothetical protein